MMKLHKRYGGREKGQGEGGETGRRSRCLSNQTTWKISLLQGLECEEDLAVSRLVK